MADKDPLQNSINNLDKTMNALNKTVSGLTKAFNDMNRTEKTRDITQQKANDVTDKLVQVLQDVKSGKAIKKDGTLSTRYKNAIEKIVTQNRDFLKKYETIRTAGYNKDNPKDKLADVYRILEVQKHLSKQIAELGNKQQWSKQDISDIKKELFGTDPGVSVDSSYKFVQNLQTGAQELIRTAGVFAQVRSEVVAFNQALKASAKAMQSSVASAGGVGKKVNDKIVQLASNSTMLNQLTKDLNKSVTRANSAIDRFTNRVNTASRNISSSTTSFRNVAKNLSTTNNTINKVNNNLTNLTKQTTNQTTSNISSFRQQQVRNSDRAKQAGFIALLIPALAKLLKKTPITDIFRYMALRWGSRLVQQGQKPVGPALAYMGAPLITGAIGTALLNKTFRGYIGKGISSVGKTLPFIGESIKYSPKGFITPSGSKIRWENLPKIWEGSIQGFRDARSGAYTTNARLAMRKSALGYEDFQSMKLLQLSGNRSTYMPQGVKTTIQGQSYDSAFKFYRNIFGRGVNAFPEWMRNMKMFSAIKDAKIPALSAKMLKRVPILGTALSAAFEIPDLIKAKKSGDKEIWGQQFAKSVGGVTGGTAGAVAGGALGALAGPLAPIATPIGAMIGGLIGDAIGRTIGPQIRRGFQVVTEPIKGTFNELKKHTKGAWEGISKIFSGIGKIGSALGSLLSPLFNLAGMLGGVILKLIGRLLGMGVGKLFNIIVTGLNNAMALIDWVVNGIGNMVQSFADGIKSFADMVKDAFHNLGQWLLTCPVIGPALQKALNQTPDDSTVEDATSPELTKLKKEHDKLVKEASLGKYKEGTLTYNNWHSELVQQYERANTKKTAGISVTPKEVKEAAQVWATEQIAKKKAELDSLIKQNETKTAKVREAIGTAIPSTAVYKTVNGVNAVDMNSLQLKGLIGSGNSVPYVASSNAQRLKLLDTYLANKGYKFTYTSAMGGNHAGGPNSHGQGQKVDLVLNNGGQLKADDVKWLKRMGFIGNGAVGWHNAGSGYHYDLSVSSGVKSSMASGSMTSPSTNTATVEAQEANMKASSELRDDLAKFIKYKDKNGKQERARNIIMSAVDVTGSLGVWGITQINNNGMRVGK